MRINCACACTWTPASSGAGYCTASYSRTPAFQRSLRALYLFGDAKRENFGQEIYARTRMDRTRLSHLLSEWSSGDSSAEARPRRAGIRGRLTTGAPGDY